MANAAKLDTVSETGTDIAVVVAQTPVVVLLDEKKRDDLFAHIRREIDAFTPDISTAKGRDAIKSFAYKITRTKTAIDAAGKELNEEARARINVVDAARRDARAELDKLAEQVRKPLTDWEEAEAARVARGQALIETFKTAAVVTLEDTAASVRERGTEIWNTSVDANDIGDDLFAEASAVKQATVVALKTALARLEKEEADRAELERLRQEAEERAEQDRLADEAAAREAREAEEARIAEERRVEAEKAEAERLARIEREAADRARREAEAAKQAEIDAANRRAEEAERAAQAERDRIAAAEAAREAEAERNRREAEARAADQAHRSAVMKAAKEAIMTCGVDEEAARKVVLLIRAGEVPHVTLGF